MISEEYIDGETLATDGNLVLALREYKGSRFLDIRKYFRDKYTKEFKPTTKGIAVNGKTYQVIKRILNQFDDKIVAWIKDDSEQMRLLEAKQKLVDREKLSAVSIEVKEDKWKSPEIFKVSPKGGKNTIVYNNTHPFCEKLNSILNEIESKQPELSQQLRGLIDHTFAALAQARYLSETGDAEEQLFSTLFYNWGIISNNSIKED